MMRFMLGTLAIASITIIGASMIEANRAKERCNAYLRSIRERTKQ